MQLFAVYVGGAIKGAHIELHDMRFVIGERIEDTYDQLRAQWWGTPSSLHLDAWMALTRADGYRISLANAPQENPPGTLFYVNLGGYDAREFAELHKNVFVVAANATEAKAKALATMQHWDQLHKDNLYAAEKCIPVLAGRQHVHLEQISDHSLPEFICAYKPIGRAKPS